MQRARLLRDAHQVVIDCPIDSGREHRVDHVMAHAFALEMDLEAVGEEKFEIHTKTSDSL
ncbi:MAG: hypothetical protein ACLFQ5_06150 [Oceanicaulis sp.]